MRINLSKLIMINQKILFLFLIIFHGIISQNILPNNGLRRILSKYQRKKRTTDDSEIPDRDIFIKKIITDLRHHIKKIDDGINSIENNVNSFNGTNEEIADVTEIPTNITTTECIKNNLTEEATPKSISEPNIRNIHIIKESTISGLLGFPNFREPKEDQIWSKWSEFTPCSTTCGLGKQIRFRQCQGEMCEAAVEIGARQCNLTACHPKIILNFNKS